MYTFNRIPKLKFKTQEAKSLAVQSREECQDRCLAEAEFLCRSAAFDSSTSTCFLNNLTQEMADPEMTYVDDDFDYMENTCVTGNSKCLGINRFIAENNKELSNPKDAMVMPSGTTKEQCRRICRDDKGRLPFICKSFHYSNELRLCLLSENNSFDKKNSSTSTATIDSPLFSYSEATCIQGGGNLESRKTKDNEDDDVVMAAVSQNLDKTSSSEPFRLLRNTILEAEPYAVYQGYVLGRCLDECLYRDSDL